MKLRSLIVIAIAVAAVATGTAYSLSQDTPHNVQYLPTVTEQAAIVDKIQYQLEFQGFSLAGTPWRDYHVSDGNGVDKAFVRINDCAVPVVAEVVYNDQGTMTPLRLKFTQPTRTAGGVVATISYEVQPTVAQSKDLCPATADVSAMQTIMQKLTAAGFAINGGVYPGSNQDFGTTLKLPGCPLVSQGSASDYKGLHIIITNAGPRSNNVMITVMPNQQEVTKRKLCPVPGR